jgi:N-acetyl-gamma-glutamyl-phosphate reductase
MINVGICGATGYAGYEALRWLRRHHRARVVFATSEAQAGKALGDVFPGPLDIPLVALEEMPLDQVDVVILALPHGASAHAAVRARKAGVRVIDVSADFRLRTPEAYKRWYGHDHPAPELLPAPYGLPEINRSAIADATLLACPGCYPTSVLLGLAPILRAGMLADPQIIIDAKSGVSGAGRGPKQNLHFVEVNENLTPYNIGQVHRHVGEMQQEASQLAVGLAPDLVFAPHLLSISRGMLSTMYVRVRNDLSEDQIRAAYADMYTHEPFVRLLPAGQLAAITHTAHTNMCAISLTLAAPGLLIVCSSIDNLVKGASGQAIQNMNLMFGLPETEGLL